MTDFYDTSVRQDIGGAPREMFDSVQGDPLFNTKALSNKKSTSDYLSNRVFDFNCVTPGIVMISYFAPSQRWMGIDPTAMKV